MARLAPALSLALALARGWASGRPVTAREGAGDASADAGAGARASAADESDGDAETVTTLLAPHAALLARLRLAYAGAGCDVDEEILPLVHRVAEYVHRLPATRAAHYQAPGGCLALGLETGFHALQAAEAQLFAGGATVLARRAAAPRWRAAAFATGLLYELHRPVFGTRVLSYDGRRWQPWTMSFTAWRRDVGADGDRIEWLPAPELPRAATLVLLPRLLGPAFMRFLEAVEGELLAQVVRTLATPDGAPRTPLGSLVDETLARLVLRERRRSGDEAPTASPPADPVPPAAADTTRVPPEDGPTAAAADAAPPETSSPEEAVPPAVPPGVRLPATLNPAIADALVALLASAADGAEAGVVFEEAGVFVPVERLTARGLDAGLAVRTLYDAGLLRPQGARKVWRRRVAGSEVAGVTLRIPAADRAAAP